MTAYDTLKQEMDKSLIDISAILKAQGAILKAMRMYGMQEYMTGLKDGKDEKIEREADQL